MINNKIDKTEKDNVILRYYGIGAQIIKGSKIKKMILLTRTKKNNRFRRLWFKNKKTRDNKMKKKILISLQIITIKISNKLRFNAENFLNQNVKTKFIYVPGIFEIPVVITRNIKKFDGFVALGCVIKVKHLILNIFLDQPLMELMKLSIDYKKPILME